MVRVHQGAHVKPCCDESCGEAFFVPVGQNGWRYTGATSAACFSAGGRKREMNSEIAELLYLFAGEVCATGFFVAALAVGVIPLVLGYKLFRFGLFNPSDMELAWRDWRVVLKRAAPGTGFAALGTGIVVAALVMYPGPGDYKSQTNTNMSLPTATDA